MLKQHIYLTAKFQEWLWDLSQGIPVHTFQSNSKLRGIRALTSGQENKK